MPLSGILRFQSGSEAHGHLHLTDTSPLNLLWTPYGPPLNALWTRFGLLWGSRVLRLTGVYT
eukprot:1183136-Prorocentrum_minimum.AAC.1